MKQIKFSIKDIVEILKARQKNEFDGNIVVSGNRGDGKSTLISKIFFRFDGFNSWKHQVYSRDDVINLLKNQKYGLCWDDEAVNSGYKRDFQNKGQQELIKMVTMYRDNFNVYASAIPSFFSLDRDLRDLVFLHIHVIERGIAIIHMPLQGRLYSQDRWDTKNNAKIEQRWVNRSKKNPDFKPPFYKLSTFKGYLFFNDLTDKQKELYLKVKKSKRDLLYNSDEPEVKKDFNTKVYELLLDGKLSKHGLQQLCLFEGKKYSSVITTLNIALKDNGNPNTVSHFLIKPSIKSFRNNDLLHKLSNV